VTTRTLAALAILLAALLTAGTWLTLRRLGRLEVLEPPAFVFENPVLKTEKWQRTIVRPMREGNVWQRYTFTALVGEPAAVEMPAMPLPYAIAAEEFRLDDQDAWYHRPADRIQALPVCLLGALSPVEWLTEIRIVEETYPDGSRKRRYRATFGHESGETVAYFYDPEHLTPGFGWVRQERYAPDDREPEVYFAHAISPFRSE
jgi:hypothetical protein